MNFVYESIKTTVFFTLDLFACLFYYTNKMIESDYEDEGKEPLPINNNNDYVHLC